MRSPLQPVSEAVFTLLQDPDLVALAGGGIWDVVPDNPSYPFVWYEVSSPANWRGVGSGSLPEIDLRVHVFTQDATMIPAQQMIDRVVVALTDQPVPVDPTIYRACGWIFPGPIISLPSEELRGTPVRELVAVFTIYIEEVQADGTAGS